MDESSRKLMLDTKLKALREGKYTDCAFLVGSSGNEEV
jgi:hypothetical protein